MRVLIVEDGRDEALRYSRELERSGFEADTAGDVATAERLAREHDFDAALVDMGLPLNVDSSAFDDTQENPINGLRLLNWLYAEVHIPVFALTGAANPDLERLIKFPLIRKPVNDFDREVIDRLRAASAIMMPGSAARAKAAADTPTAMNVLTQSSPDEHAIFIGDALADLAACYTGRQCTVHTASSFNLGRIVIDNIPPVAGKTAKFLLVVATALESDRGCRHLRQLVEPLEGSGLRGFSPRTVLVGAMTVSDFSAIRALLWSHVVDWLPPDLDEKTALARLDGAWKKESFRRRLLGLGLVSGAPVHVATHHRSRLQLAADLRLEDLFSEPSFSAAMRGAPNGAGWDSLTDMLYRYLSAAMKDEPPRWEQALALGPMQLEQLKASGLREREDLLLLLRCWCGALANCFEGVVEMTRKDLKELEEFYTHLERDFLKGGDDEYHP